ncbi:MAG: D-alanine--D-alanine ligase [Patescibacteria group bacterium]
MKRVALLTGGTSSEREVALKSAAAVRGWLAAQHDVAVYDLPRDLDRFIAERASFDVAVPVFHGKGGEDGIIQGFLKTLGVPFVFSDVEAHAIGMDKVVAKTIVASAGVPTTTSRIIQRGESGVFERPSVVKVPDGGSSVGVFLAKDAAAFEDAVRQGFVQSDRLLVEDFIEGCEFTVSVVDHGGKTVALPIIEIRSKKAFFDLESKYDPVLAEELCPALIPSDLTERLQALALRAHHAIGARHVTRTDFIVDVHGNPWFLEINTIPGMTEVSLLPKSVKVAGLTMEELFDEWIATAG